MRDRIQQIIAKANSIADVLHKKCENLIAADVESIAHDLEAAIAPQWVPVANPPYHNRNVIVCYCYPDGRQEQDAAKYVAGLDMWFFAAAPDGAVVTHWHEIDYPQPPQEQQQ